MRGEREGGGRRAELLLILLFWSAVFVLNSVRGAVAGEIPFPLILPHRIAVLGFGALLCWLMTFVLERYRSRSFVERLLAAAAGAAAMSVLQSLFHMASCRVSPIPGYAPMTPEEAVNAGLASFAYFTAWSWMHLALLAHEEARADRPAASRPEAPRERVFWASRGRHHVRIEGTELVWAEAQKDYVMLHAPGGGGMVRETLSALQESLDPELFVRVHRSALVRRSAIAAVRRRPSGSLVATLATGEEVPVGRSYAGGLRSLLGKMRAPG